MTLDEFNASIRTAFRFFEEEGFVESAVYMVSLPRSAEFNKISLTTQIYADLFESGLSLSHYNFLLKDLAYFQFSYRSSSEWALAYNPNPRISGCPDALEEFLSLRESAERGEITDEDFSALASSIDVGNYVPRIRFEYSESQSRPIRHPTAHFHIGMSGEDRWSSSRKISPRSFGLLIAKHYYPEIWWNKSRFALSDKDQKLHASIAICLDNKLVKSLHSDGASLAFTEDEKQNFHFSAMQPSA